MKSSITKEEHLGGKTMIVKRNKQFAVVTDEAIRKGLAKAVAESTEYIKKHPIKLKFIHSK